MIGGTMLMCAVGAMLLLAWWSITRDDIPDSQPRDGLLALQNFAIAKKDKTGPIRRRREPGTRQNEARQTKPDALHKLRKLEFDPHEMAEIAEEAEATLPRFVRDAREEY